MEARPRSCQDDPSRWSIAKAAKGVIEEALSAVRNGEIERAAVLLDGLLWRDASASTE